MNANHRFNWWRIDSGLVRLPMRLMIRALTVKLEADFHPLLSVVFSKSYESSFLNSTSKDVSETTASSAAEDLTLMGVKFAIHMIIQLERAK